RSGPRRSRQSPLLSYPAHRRVERPGRLRHYFRGAAPGEARPLSRLARGALRAAGAHQRSSRGKLAARSMSRGPLQNFRGLRALVLAPEDHNRKILHETLERLGLVVTCYEPQGPDETPVSLVAW